jgi:hypothetical protein
MEHKMRKAFSVTVGIAAGTLALAGAAEFCMMSWSQIGIWTRELSPRARVAVAQTSVEAKSSTVNIYGAAAATRIVVPCEAGSPADLVAQDLAKVLSAQHGHTCKVENLSPDAARNMMQQQDSQPILFFGLDADGPPVCGD